MLLLSTSNDPASASIARSLVAGHGFAECGPGRWKRGGVELLDTGAPTVLDVPADFDSDCIIILSKHRSRAGGRMLTAHVPGNWDAAEMGGKPRTLNVAPASVLKVLLQELAAEGKRIGWPVSLEADHHGPQAKVPLVFVEIGSSENEWGDAGAATAVANAVARLLDRMGGAKPEAFRAAFCVGGGHYPKAFTRIALETDIAPGHILPKYSIGSLAEDTFRQAIEKNVENVASVLVAKDETNSAQREKVRKLAEAFGVACELV